MPSFVISEKCDGCKGGDKTACMYICPNDLMVLDPNEMKAYNQEPDQCWECFSCVKICPTQAVEVRGYADFVPLGSSIMPMMGTEDVMWTCKFRNGTIKRFKFPIRTTAEGSANDYADLKGQDIESQLLSTEGDFERLALQSTNDGRIVQCEKSSVIALSSGARSATEPIAVIMPFLTFKTTFFRKESPLPSINLPANINLVLAITLVSLCSNNNPDYYPKNEL